MHSRFSLHHLVGKKISIDARPVSGDYALPGMAVKALAWIR